jgi:hypothetical protein
MYILWRDILYIYIVGLVTVGLWIKEGWVLREPLLCRCPRAASHKEWCTGEFEGRYHTFVLYETYAKGSVVLYGKLRLRLRYWFFT